MAGEEQYFNPIIQSMIAAQQQNLSRDQLKAAIEQHKTEQMAREHQLNLEQQRIEHEHEHQLNQIELARQAHELAATAAKFQNLKAANDLSRGGVDVGAALQSVGAAPIAGIAPYEQQVQREQAEAQGIAGAQTTGQQTALAPFKAAEAQREFENKQALAEQDAQNRMKEIGVHTVSAEKIAALNADRNESVARINGGYHLAGIRMMHQLGMGDQSEMAKQLVDGIYNGNRDIKTLTPDEKRLVEGYASGTGELSSLPTNNKSYVKSLDALSGIQTLMNQYRDLAVNYSSDSPGAAQKGNQSISIPIYGTVQRTRPGSDLESKLDALKSSGGQLATFFDQQNRKSDQEILRAVAGSFNPKATKKQNLEKLDQHLDQLKATVDRTFPGVSKDRINSVLSNIGVTDFGPTGSAPSVPPGTSAPTGPTSSYTNIHVSPDGKKKIGQIGTQWYDIGTGQKIGDAPTAAPAGGQQ